ncbi:hypothetical protein J437_LFUL002951 [Ladona fulva]|uniref:Uncharacterized protein n=1 Tax=Ladona fulva TaxID=123851 RepID=A0A8K0K9D3_LADFU|nr:hypothetical protein J437_LFUL002951 [Ladona fulva]
MYHDAVVDLPERPSPDGGEERGKPDIEAEEDGLEEVAVDWSDWDAPEEDLENSIATEQSKASEISSNIINDSQSGTVAEPSSEVVDDSNSGSKESRSSKEKSKASQAEEEEDFFKDMEPVISKTQILRIEAPESSKQASLSLNAFSKVPLDSTADIEGSGWEDDLEWGDEELEIS